MDVDLTFNDGCGVGSSNNNDNDDNNRHNAFRRNFEYLITCKLIYCKYTLNVIEANQQVKPPKSLILLLTKAIDRTDIAPRNGQSTSVIH